MQIAAPTETVNRSHRPTASRYQQRCAAKSTASSDWVTSLATLCDVALYRRCTVSSHIIQKQFGSYYTGHAVCLQHFAPMAYTLP